MRILVYVALFLATGASAQGLQRAVAVPKLAASSAEAGPCEPGSNLPGVQCMAELQKKQDRELNDVYRAALLVLPESDSWDNRRNREHLVKAQRAWLQFRLEHCTVVGWREGGSNMSATFASQQCQWKLTEERMEFLRSMKEAR